MLSYEGEILLYNKKSKDRHSRTVDLFTCLLCSGCVTPGLLKTVLFVLLILYVILLNQCGLTLGAPQQTLVDLTVLPTSSRCHSTNFIWVTDNYDCLQCYCTPLFIIIASLQSSVVLHYNVYITATNYAWLYQL